MGGRRGGPCMKRCAAVESRTTSHWAAAAPRHMRRVWGTHCRVRRRVIVVVVAVLMSGPNTVVSDAASFGRSRRDDRVGLAMPSAYVGRSAGRGGSRGLRGGLPPHRGIICARHCARAVVVASWYCCMWLVSSSFCRCRRRCREPHSFVSCCVGRRPVGLRGVSCGRRRRRHLLLQGLLHHLRRRWRRRRPRRPTRSRGPPCCRSSPTSQAASRAEEGPASRRSLAVVAPPSPASRCLWGS